MLNWQMMIPELFINFVDCHLWFAVLCILFNPLYWNLVRLFLNYTQNNDDNQQSFTFVEYKTSKVENCD